MHLPRRLSCLASLVVALVLGTGQALASATCPAERPAPLLPADPAQCAALLPAIRAPHALPLDQYEAKLATYLRNFCYRDPAAGWHTDKAIRDTGPYTARLVGGEWVGTYYGTHAPVIVWYSADMFAWMRANRPEDPAARPAHPAPVPDGAIMVKEMYPAPAAACRGIDPSRLLPTSGAAIMVRDATASHDGWFWGWFGWNDWSPDWPAKPAQGLADMGFGQYCLNCHASASDNSTFASLRNVKGEPGHFLNFLSQDFFLGRPALSRFAPILERDAEVDRPEPATPLPDTGPDHGFLEALRLPGLAIPDADAVARMPGQVYDSVWMGVGAPTVHGTFVTSDQCLGCHSAGSTGLQFDMTAPQPDGRLLNLSPYGAWRTTPMGLAGRDPMFFAQLASEIGHFHPEVAPMLQDTCLGCHGVQGQRQAAIDRGLAGATCPPFLRSEVDAVPWPSAHASAEAAKYGALARDGIACAVCHRMELGKDAEALINAPQNRCVAARQALLNPHQSGFARMMTGSFLLGPPGQMFGPFADPKQQPMLNALGVRPEKGAAIRASELCGTCHSVHLPVLRHGDTLGYVYEQATYAEWAFSAYRTGTTVDGPLPLGAGATPRSCEDCHMPSDNAAGKPFLSKIASIQEFSDFPQAEETAGPDAIDLPVRSGFAHHAPVGLNLFLITMARQFPGILGIPTYDPMLTRRAVPPLEATTDAILQQADTETATIRIGAVTRADGKLRVTVTVTNLAGHKFPSGVGFRRAFIAFAVLDAKGKTIWESGRTDRSGVIVGPDGTPITGELWWTRNCGARIAPLARLHQPHYRLINQQDQAQIYEELVSAPPAEGPAHCGHDQAPAGQLTTSFLAICAPVKDNRLLPHGYLGRAERVLVAQALGAGPDLADEVGPVGVGDDPAYRAGGGDSVTYLVDLAALPTRPVALRATLYYQATPPYYLQDRFCTSQSRDTQRLSFIASRLKLDGTRIESWKLRIATTGRVGLH